MVAAEAAVEKGSVFVRCVKGAENAPLLLLVVVVVVVVDGTVDAGASTGETLKVSTDRYGVVSKMEYGSERGEKVGDVCTE